MSSSTMPAITQRQTMRGHTDWVRGVVHLHGGRRIITCSWDGSLRLWDLESGAQVGEDWLDEEKDNAVWTISLSPNGKTIASGSDDGTMRLWDVETGMVVAKWTGDIDCVYSLCWSADGERLVSGSQDGTTRLWDVNIVGTSETVVEIKTGRESVWAVIYSPDNTKFATGGSNEKGVKIRDAKTSALLATLQHDDRVYSLAWTSDGKKLISASHRLIRIFNTATWQQVAILEGHQGWVDAVSLSQNGRLLASASDDKTARLWNLDTYLPVGPPLQHQDELCCAALSPDGNIGKVLVTGGRDENVYTWDVHASLKEAGLGDLLPTGTNIAPKDRLEQDASQDNSGIERTPRSSLSDKSFLEADATRCHGEFGNVDGLSPRFFDGLEADDSSPTGVAHPHSSANALLARLSSLFHRFRADNAEANRLPQPSTSSRLHPRVLLGHLSPLFHRSPPENDGTNESRQHSTPSELDLRVLFARLSSLLPRSRLNTDEETEPHTTMPWGSHPDGLIDLVSSLFHSQPHINEEIELPQSPSRPHVVEVAAMRDREVLFVAEPLQPYRLRTQPVGTTTPGARPAYPLPLRMLAHLVLFLCCASPQHAEVNEQPQQGQSQGPVQSQASSPQTQHATPLTSTRPTALDTGTTAPRAAAA